MKFSSTITHLIEDEATRVAIDRAFDTYIGKVLRHKAISKEMLSEHIYQIPPAHDADAEEEFVGRLIKFPMQAIEFLARRNALSTDLFYTEQFKLVYSVCEYRYQASKSINVDAIISELREAGELLNCGGEEQIRLLVVGIESPQGIEEYGEALIANWELRQMWGQAAQAISDIQHLKTNEVAEYREQLVQNLSNLSNLHQSNKGGYDGDSLADKMLAARAKYKTQTTIPHPTHLDKLTAHTGGWSPTDLVVIAARPAMGKTSYVLADMMCALDNDEPCAFFSLEMGDIQLCWRMLSIYFEIPDIMLRLKNNELTEADEKLFDAFVEKMRSWKIYIIDDLFYIHQIAAKAKVLAKLHGIKRIYLDYIQLCNVLKSPSVEQTIAEISRTCKLLARELNLVFIALSQLSREVEKRADKRPNLSDLRYSGAIEQDADIVAFLYRAEYYGMLEDEDGNSLKGVGEFIIAKYRGGALDTIKAFFNAPCVKWDNLDKLNDEYTNATNAYFENLAIQAQPVSTFSNKNQSLELSESSKLNWASLDD